MKLIKSIYIILISIIMIFLGGLVVNANHSFMDIETKINSKSGPEKIKKMQLVLKHLNIYSGEIDGKFKSVEPSLIKYQKKTGLIKTSVDYGAGYFGVKTLTALKKDYPVKFEKVTNQYLKMDEPTKGITNYIVTAYYSPLPNQERYSYSSKLKRYRTYSEAIKMQGRGTHGASGKAVHVGFIAAPKNYKFGTKIELEGIGVGVVEDRGGAIVNAGDRKFSYDRIDIWMGYGDEGRIRADKWGVRTIKGKIVPKNTKITIEFDKSVVSNFSKLKVDAENPKKENVIKLQELLTATNKYKGPIDGKFISVKKALIDFQIKKKIITSKNDPHAGYFGKKTYLALKKEYGSGIFKNRKNNIEENILLSMETKEKLNNINNKITKLINKKYGKNTNKAKEYKKKIKKLIDKHILKIKNKEKKKQLKYLKTII